jgi:hypothetical protein
LCIAVNNILLYLIMSHVMSYEINKENGDD